jgi:methylglutamate dehydrogenase subunit A
MSVPQSARYVIVGAGMHGLSTAYHLAKGLSASGRGSGADIIVIDKSHVAAGASGIACGVVRNNYFQPAMRELMAHSVSVWESDPAAYAYNGVGYMQISPDAMAADVATIYEQQKAIGYESVLIEGAADCNEYMTNMFADWRAKNITSVLHEKKGGFAHNTKSIEGLAAKARGEGVAIHTDVRVTGVTLTGGAVTSITTDQGDIACDHLVVAVGPWVRDFWHWLGMPDTVDVKGRDGQLYNRPMWTYWSLQEGTLGVDPRMMRDNDGNVPPVIHVDTDAPLYDDEDGSLITDQMWGIYFKPDPHFGGIQGGAMPFIVPTPTDEVKVDPYGPASPDFIVGDDFKRMWTSALAHCMERFSGQRSKYRDEPSGGIGCFTPDSFPMFDTFCQNAYVIADSNHGYKMIGVGALVAEELLGNTQSILEPFRFSRYAEGKLHPVSNSPYPWS